MKIIRNKIWALIFFTVMVNALYAEEKKPFERPKNSLNIELFGPTLYYYSVQYERFVIDNLLINIGINFIPEIYFPKTSVIGLPVSLQYSIPIKNWGIDLGTGLVFFYVITAPPWLELTYAYLHLGVRYYPLENLLLKIYFVPTYDFVSPKYINFSMRILPSFGLSIGYAF